MPHPNKRNFFAGRILLHGVRHVEPGTRVLVEKVHAIKTHLDLGLSSRVVVPNVGQARYIPARACR